MFVEALYVAGTLWGGFLAFCCWCGLLVAVPTSPFSGRGTALLAAALVLGGVGARSFAPGAR